MKSELKSLADFSRIYIMDEKKLLKYLQNECDELEAARLLEWLSESEENRRELFRLEVAWQLGQLKRYSDKDFVREQKEKLQERIAAAELPRRTFFPLRMLRYVAACVVFALLAGGAYFFYTSQAMEVLTAGQEVEQIVLPDGTKVWLNKNSLLKYPKHFGTSKRFASVEGEAYFEVTKNADKPFVVETEAMKITVLGTVFNLNSFTEANTASVTLLEGEVKVEAKADEGLVVLSPGQRAELDKLSGKLYVKSRSQAALDAAWHNKLIPFEQATVEEIAKALEEIYGVKVRIAPDIDKTTYSGTLKNQGSIEKALRSLKNSIPIKYELKSGEVYISRD